MRNTFINRLCEMAAVHEDVFLLCGDLGYSVLEPFAEQFPDRYLNAGIAEQNMTQVAVGLAREGYNVFTYSIGNFPTLRCMEQIRYDACYHQANVKIVAVGSGYAYGPQGVSHHTTEDLAMMRVLPNMQICAPADASEAKAAAEYMASYQGTAYVRLNKNGEMAVHDPASPLSFQPDLLIPVRKGKDVAVLATGAILGSVLVDIQKSGHNWSVYSAPFVGSYSEATLTKLAQTYTEVITVEEHQLNAGFGSSIIEGLSDLYSRGVISQMPRVKRIGIPNSFIGVCGSQEYLRKEAGLGLFSE